MSKAKSPSEVAPLFNWSEVRLHELALNEEIPLIASESFHVFSHENAFTYRDILMIEVALQMNDDGGIPMTTASKLVRNAGIDACGDGADYWIAIMRYRNTWGGSTDRGSLPVTEIGPGEYWSSAHFSGSFAEAHATPGNSGAVSGREGSRWGRQPGLSRCFYNHYAGR